MAKKDELTESIESLNNWRDTLPDLPPQIVDVGDNIEQWVNALLYGPSGVGKTTLAATAPKPLLLLNTDLGERSVRNVDGVKKWTIRTADDLDAAIAWLVKNPSAFQTVVLDSMTVGQQRLEADVLGKSGKAQMSQQLYGKLKQRTGKMINNLRNLPCHFVATAEMKTSNDAEGNVSMRQPNLVGSIKDEVGHVFDVVALLGARELPNDETEYLTRVQGGATWVAKLRDNPFGKFAPNDLTMVFEKMNEIEAEASELPAEMMGTE